MDTNNRDVTLTNASYDDDLVDIHSRAIQNLPFFKSKRTKIIKEPLHELSGNKDQDTSLSTPRLCSFQSKPNCNKKSSSNSITEYSSHIVIEFRRLRKHLMKLKRRKFFLISEIEREKCLNKMEHVTVEQKISNILLLANIKSNMRPYLHPLDIKQSNNFLRNLSSTGINSNFHYVFSKSDVSSYAKCQHNNDSNVTALISKTICKSNDSSNKQNLIKNCFKTNYVKNENFTSSSFNLASKLSTLRKRRKFIAAHSLSGISCIYIAKENCIGAKIEICIDGGIFISSHCAIFEMIKYDHMEVKNCRDKANTNINHNHYPHDNGSAYNNDEAYEHIRKEKTIFRNNMYRIQLIQHTLPFAIKVNQILEQNFCTEIISFDDASYTYNPPEIIHSLRNCLGDMYDAAYSYAQRVSACRRLENMMIDDTNDKIINESKMMIKNVSHSESYDFITFSLFTFKQSKLKVRRKTNYEKNLKIELKYTNQILSIPTHVEVVLSIGSKKIFSSTNVSDESIDSNCNIRDAYKTFAPLFRVMGIIEAANRSWAILQKTV